MPGCWVANLIMTKANKEDHRASKSTLWRSHAQAWIEGGRRLAAKVERSCTFCRKKKEFWTAQQMGNLPEEKILPGCKPFTAICLDFMGV